MTPYTLMVGLVTATWLAIIAPASALPLVQDGRATSVIVIDDQATASAKAGAAELQYHLEKMSGVRVPITTANDASTGDETTLILIGRSARTDALGVDLSKVPPEGFIIRTLQNALVLAGDDAGGEGGQAEDVWNANVRTGSLFAVYALLQDQLGCRWIWPGPSGEHIPRRETVALASLDIIQGPALERRHMRLMMHRAYPDADRLLDPAPREALSDQERQWYLRMRMGRHAPGPRGHSFGQHWERYKDSDPDIFALLPNGERGYVGSPRRIKMCVANPKLIDILIAEFEQARQSNPDHRVLHACEADGRAGHCTCALCKAADATLDNLPPDVLAGLTPDLYEALKPREDGVPGTLSTRYARFLNELSRRVRAIDPDAYVTMYAMTRMRQTPIDVEMEPNLMVNYVGFNSYPLTPAERAAERQNLTGWISGGAAVVLRPNAPHFAGDGMPYNVAREMADDFHFALDHGLVQAEFDAMLGYWASWGPTYYVLSRMMWEGRDADPEALITEWLAAFGPAQREMRAYYDFWERYLRSVYNRPGFEAEVMALGEGRGGNRAARLLAFADIYTPAVLAEARALLDQAMEAASAADASVKEKLANVEMNQHNAELTSQLATLTRAAWDQPDEEAALSAAREALLEHRRTIAPHNATNVYWMTQYEIQNGDPFGWRTMPQFANEAE